jgi:hypothetical protein
MISNETNSFLVVKPTVTAKQSERQLIVILSSTARLSNPRMHARKSISTRKTLSNRRQPVTLSEQPLTPLLDYDPLNSNDF